MRLPEALKSRMTYAEFIYLRIFDWPAVVFSQDLIDACDSSGLEYFFYTKHKLSNTKAAVKNTVANVLTFYNIAGFINDHGEEL